MLFAQIGKMHYCLLCMEKAIKDDYQATIFCNRLKKNYRRLRKWARKNETSCYRLYDRDIPEIPLAVDVFELAPAGYSDAAEIAAAFTAICAARSANDTSVETAGAEQRYAVVFLYERPYETAADAENRWLAQMAETAATVLGIANEHVITKIRRRDKGGRQYAPVPAAASPIAGIVVEHGILFSVDLTGHVDAGLFFDHRPLRKRIKAMAQGATVLNLFCYTGSFSVYAALGGAAHIDSVDWSHTYLAWAQKNCALNGIAVGNKLTLIRADVGTFLAKTHRQYDIIILDPPTFSNSKSRASVLDTNRDWATLVFRSLTHLAPGGTLFFSTNSRRLSFDAERIQRHFPELRLVITDITAETIPEDYRGKKIHRTWEIKRR